MTTNDRLLIVEGRDDTVRVTTLPGSPRSGLAAADLTPGGRIGMFASITGGRVGGFDDQGVALGGWPALTGDPAVTLGQPALGDLDGDGAIEVVCGGDDGNVWAWSGGGTIVTGFPVYLGAEVVGGVALSQLDDRTGVEIAVATSLGDVFVIDGAGVILDGWPLRVPTPITAPAIGRLGTQITPAILVGTGTTLHALSPAGSARFTVPLTAPAGGVVLQDVALGDLDGDGADEIVAVTRGPATISVFDSSGARLTARGWPRALADTAQGPPVIGPLRAGRPWPGVAVFAGGVLLAFTDSAATIRAFPKSGGAGLFPSLVDLDRTSSTQVLAGTGPDSVLFVYDAGPGTAGSAPSPWFTPRGNFARTGSRLYAPPLSTPDHVPPAAVADLAADSIGLEGVRLAWTAPGDDGTLGRASGYDVRHSTRRINDGNFGSADSVAGAPAPAVAAQLERLVVSGLERGVTYFFRLRTRDESDNVSQLSNTGVVTPGLGEPGRVLDLAVIATGDTVVTLGWSATGDDGPAGRPLNYFVYASTEPISGPGPPTPGEDLLVRVVEAVVAAGLAETYDFVGLEPGHDYYFAVIAQDDGTANSALSNVATARTGLGGPLAGRSGIAIASRAQPSDLPVELHWQGPGTVQAGQSIRIYDVAGRRVRAFGLPAQTAGVQTWDGRDDGGDLVPAGLYYARLVSGSFHSQTRVVLLP